MIDLSNYDTADLVADLEKRDRKALEAWYTRLEKEWEHKRDLAKQYGEETE